MEPTRKKINQPRVLITISAQGSKKFKQQLVDKIYELLMDEDFLMEASKPGNGLTFNSSLPPREIF